MKEEAKITCTHSFCLHCILQWSLVTNACPLCKGKFNEVVGQDGTKHAVKDCTQTVLVEPDDDLFTDSGDDSSSESDDAFDFQLDPDYVPSTPAPMLIATPTEDEPPVQPSTTKKRKIRDDIILVEEMCRSLIYRCDVKDCGKEFKRKGDFDRHLLSHQGDESKKFECDVCGKKFKLKGDLKIHSLSHGDKKFKCDVCDEEFTTKGNMDRHKKTRHLKEKRFCCQVCDKKFGQAGDLKRHALTHAAPEERPYFCGPCGVGFAQKKNYTVHCKTVHS